MPSVSCWMTSQSFTPVPPSTTPIHYHLEMCQKDCPDYQYPILSKFHLHSSCESHTTRSKVFECLKLLVSSPALMLSDQPGKRELLSSFSRTSECSSHPIPLRVSPGQSSTCTSS